MRFLRSTFLFIIYLLCFLGGVGILYKDSFRHQWSPKELQGNEQGVIFYDRWRASDGYNVVNTSLEQPSCVVYSMRGDFVFRFPGGFCYFLDSGEFFTISATGLQFYNAGGRPLWKISEEFIHQIAHVSADEKEIFVITGETRMDRGRKIRYESIRGYSLKGEKTFEWKVENNLDYFNEENFPYVQVRPTMAFGNNYNLTNINSVQVIPTNPIEGVIPAFKAGNILVNDFHYSLVYIIDRQTKKVIWSRQFNKKEWGGAQTLSMLPNGHLFYLLNRNELEKGAFFSSLVEWDPIYKMPVWEYKADPVELFAIKTGGTAFPLPNGNILVTHATTGGSAFEVTRKGRIVWEWVYPVKNIQGRAEPVYQVQRISKAKVDKVLKVWKFN